MKDKNDDQARDYNGRRIKGTGKWSDKQYEVEQVPLSTAAPPVPWEGRERQAVGRARFAQGRAAGAGHSRPLRAGPPR